MARAPYEREPLERMRVNVPRAGTAADESSPQELTLRALHEMGLLRVNIDRFESGKIDAFRVFWAIGSATGEGSIDALVAGLKSKEKWSRRAAGRSQTPTFRGAQPCARPSRKVGVL